MRVVRVCWMVVIETLVRKDKSPPPGSAKGSGEERMPQRRKRAMPRRLGHHQSLRRVVLMAWTMRDPAGTCQTGPGLDAVGRLLVDATSALFAQEPHAFHSHPRVRPHP